MAAMRGFVGALFVVSVLALPVIGCGHSEDEWQRAQNANAKLRLDLDASNRLRSADDERYADQQKQIDELTTKLGTLVAALKRDPIGQLQSLGFSEQQIANLLLHKDKDARDDPPPPPPQPRAAASDWKILFNGPLQGEGVCGVKVSLANEGPDPTAILRTGNPLRLAFVKQEYGNKKDCPKEKSRTSLQHVRFDCSGRTIELLSGYDVDWNDKRTDIDFQGAGIAPFTVYPDNSFGDAEWRYVCGAP
jgi:hypothetical protein